MSKPRVPVKARPVVPTPTLRVTDGQLAGTVVRLDASPATIGRRPENTYVLADRSVSRVHAQISRHAGAVIVTDLGSTGGTAVNGMAVENAVVLHHGDQLTFGTVSAVFEDPRLLTADEHDTQSFQVSGEPTDPHAELSPRQQQVLELIAEGLTNDEIGHRLGVTERTVKAYAAEIYNKFGVPNRAAAVAQGVEYGLL